MATLTGVLKKNDNSIYYLIAKYLVLPVYRVIDLCIGFS